jgi:hypothetical protein
MALNGVNLAQIAQKSLDVLMTKLPLLSMFSTDFSSDVAQSGASVTTRIATAPTSGDISAGYATSAQSGTTTPKTVTLDVLTGSVIGFTEAEWAMTSVKLPELFIRPGINVIAKGMVDAALALVTNANFGAAIFTGLANTFDTDDLTDIQAALTAASVPPDDRFMLLNSSYFASLFKDDAVKNAAAFGGAEGIRNMQIPRLMGFSPVAEYYAMPATDNLVGITGGKQGLLIATRLPAVPDNFPGQIEVAKDPESGLAIQLRQWYSPDAGRYFLSMALIPGVALGNAACLKRMVSA